MRPNIMTAPPSQLGSIPNGAAGVESTLSLMQSAQNAGKKSLIIRQTAANIVQGLPQKAFMQEIAALQNFVRDSIRYVRDVHGVETLQSAEYTLANEYGDCDDKAVLLAALLGSIGVPTAFEAVGFRPGVYSHVLALAQYQGAWIPLETIMDGAQPGWYPPGVVARMRVIN